MELSPTVDRARGPFPDVELVEGTTLADAIPNGGWPLERRG
jgi:hypothetical protein